MKTSSGLCLHYLTRDMTNLKRCEDSWCNRRHELPHNQEYEDRVIGKIVKKVGRMRNRFPCVGINFTEANLRRLGHEKMCGRGDVRGRMVETHRRMRARIEGLFTTRGNITLREDGEVQWQQRLRATTTAVLGQEKMDLVGDEVLITTGVKQGGEEEETTAQIGQLSSDSRETGRMEIISSE